jgi:hypothetical protein
MVERSKLQKMQYLFLLGSFLLHWGQKKAGFSPVLFILKPPGAGERFVVPVGGIPSSFDSPRRYPFAPAKTRK